MFFAVDVDVFITNLNLKNTTMEEVDNGQSVDIWTPGDFHGSMRRGICHILLQKTLSLETFAKNK